jgi:hypothetical protein
MRFSNNHHWIYLVKRLESQIITCCHGYKHDTINNDNIQLMTFNEVDTRIY